MSAQASKAARELAKSLVEAGFICEGAHPADVGYAIQSALADLLEKARAVTDHAPGASPMRSVARYLRLKTALKSALGPWKAGE